MKKEKVIVIKPNGEVVTIYSDAFPLKNLGKSKIQRASNVLFDEEVQKWYIEIQGNKLEKFFDSRNDCIEYEVQYLNDILMNN